MSLKFLLSLISVGAVGTTSWIGYELLKPGNKESNKSHTTKSENTIPSIETEKTNEQSTLNSGKSTESHKEADNLNKQESTSLPKQEETQEFSGILWFTTNTKKDKETEKLDKAKRDLPHYRVELLNEKQETDNSMGDEDDDDGEESQDFGIPIKTQDKEKAKKYLNELTEKFRTSSTTKPVRDKPSLKEYLKQNKSDLKFKDYFESGEGNVYDKILQELDSLK